MSVPSSPTPVKDSIHNIQEAWMVKLSWNLLEREAEKSAELYAMLCYTVN